MHGHQGPTSVKPAVACILSLAMASAALAEIGSGEIAGSRLSHTPWLEQIVVTATRTRMPLLQVPASVTSLDMEKLRTLGFTFGTDGFRGVPGVNFRRNEGDGDEFTSVTIRGVTGNHGNVTRASHATPGPPRQFRINFGARF